MREWNRDPNNFHELENESISMDGTKGDDRRRTYNEVYPEIRGVTGIKVGASGKPFGTKVIRLSKRPLGVF